jgi:hypothetical protein
MAAACAFRGCALPAHVDQITRIKHDYCCRTHAQAALAARNLVLAPPHGACHE